MDLSTLLQELGNVLEDRDNPESDIILINLIEEIRRVLPREPDKAADLLTGTLMALGTDQDNRESFMNLTMVHSMVPEILAGLRPLPVRPPNIQIGLLMLGEAISREELSPDTTETFYNILVKPFIDEGEDLSSALNQLVLLTAEDPMAKCHAELATEWIKNNVPVPMDLTEDTPPSPLNNQESKFFGYLVELSVEQNPMKQLVLLKKMFSVVQGPFSNSWYSEQLGKIMDTIGIDDQAIFDSALIANDFWESQKKKMSSDTK